MVENLDNKIEDDESIFSHMIKQRDIEQKLDEVGQKFTRLVNERMRDAAKLYFQTLTSEQQHYITVHKQYGIALKALRVSYL